MQVNANSAVQKPRWPQYGLDIMIACQPVQAEVEPFWPSVLRDVLEDGVTLVVPFFINPGGRVMLSLAPDGSAQRWELLVKQSRRHSNATSWVLRCSFVNPAEHQEMTLSLSGVSSPFFG